MSSHAGKSGTPTEVFSGVPENDDQEERRQRQLSRLQKLQNSGDVSSPISSDRQKSISMLEPKLTGQQLALHYAKCIQLSAENKISIKNAFNLQLIDYMTEMLARKDSDMNNFQMASCTLDASTKIYAYRVDCVHTDTMRMAGGLGRTQQEKQQLEGSDPANPSQAVDPLTKRKRNKKTATIESNPSNLSLSSLELEFMIDPLFKKISSQFDEGRAGGGLFLNSLALKDDCCQLLLDSQAVVGDSASISVEKKSISIPPLPDMAGVSICPSFSSFHFNNWNVSDESFLECEEDKKDVHHTTHAFDINAIPEPLDDPMEDAMDFEGAGFDNDGGNDDEFDSLAANDGGNSTAMTVGCEGQHYKSLPAMETIHLKDHLATMPLEYSYFDARVMSAWAGPGHWKLKPAFKGKSEASKEDGPSKKKEPFELNYSSFNEKLADIDKHFVVTKRMTKLSHMTVKQWCESNTTLPFDLHFDPNDFSKLRGRPEVVVRRLNQQVTVETLDDSIHEYDHDNDGNQDYCADMEPPEEGDNDVTRAFSQTILPSQNEGAQFLGDNLVAAPNKVAKINIGYARTAKRMDMKKLKSALWNMLTDEKDKENDLNGANHQPKADEEKVLMNPNTSLQFSAIYKTLPGNLSSNMAENLSFPLAFIALLHLCNEKTLELRPLDGMKDFNIMQG